MALMLRFISKSGEINQKAAATTNLVRKHSKNQVRPVSQTTKTQGPIINQAAFEPDADRWNPRMCSTF